ncbi:hypothetical protein [Rhodoferax sp.]|uniref:hypothetical protein n=1 Tax=Rhodoferax sp. TaxID=50421 RepID=UPI002ACE5CB4|nr:hypothetical protein [Rhodoferax sp.]
MNLHNDEANYQCHHTAHSIIGSGSAHSHRRETKAQSKVGITPLHLTPNSTIYRASSGSQWSAPPRTVGGAAGQFLTSYERAPIAADVTGLSEDGRTVRTTWVM